MTDQAQLSGSVVAISISKSPDMEVLGLGQEHLDDALAEVIRYLLVTGARVIYGGDLRQGNFTNILFELVARYQSDASTGDGRAAVRNFFAWPVHISFSAEQVRQLSEDVEGMAELVYLTADGTVMPADERQQLAPRPAAEEEWSAGLTAMRRLVTTLSHARIVIGGQVEGFKGSMPGVAEEALLSLQAGQPLFLLGGFGGCAYDIACDLGLIPSSIGRHTPWPSRAAFKNFSAENLNNGLNAEENTLLAATAHVDQAMALILRGLLRLHGNNVLGKV